MTPQLNAARHTTTLKPMPSQFLTPYIKVSVAVLLFIATVQIIPSQPNSPLSNPSPPSLNSNILGVQYTPAHQETIDTCLKEQFTQSQYQLYIDPQGQQRDITELGTNRLNQAKNCFNQSYSQFLTKQQQSCLETALTTEKYNDIVSGKITASQADTYNASICFPNPQIISLLSTNQTLPNYDQLCLQTQLDRYSELIQDPSIITSLELRIARSCILTQTPLTQTPINLIGTDQTANCLLNQLGYKRLQEIQTTGTSTPKEKNITQECFTNTNQIHATFLPLPPTQIPFIEPKSDTITINQISIKETKPTQQIVQLSGTSTPNSLVDIYLLQKQLVIWTVADSQGNWIAQTSYPIQPGDYTAIASSTQISSNSEQPSRTHITSQPYEFSAVKKVQTPIATDQQIRIVPSDSKYFPLQIGISIILILGAISLLGWTYQKQPNKKRKTLPLP